MGKKHLHRIDFGEITRGLMSDRPPTAIENGGLSVADNIMLDDGVLSKTPGYARLSKTLPMDHAFNLDGGLQYWRGRTIGTASLVALNGSAWTLDVIFKIDAFPSEQSSTGEKAVLLYKGSGSAAAADAGTGDLDWQAYIAPSSGQYFITFQFREAGGGTIKSVTDVTALSLNTYYQATITYSGALLAIFVGPSASAAPGAATTSSAWSDTVRDGANDFLVGASARSSPTRLDDVVQYPFTGVIQEIRFWNDDRSAGEVSTYWGRQLTSAEQTSETELIAYYPLTLGSVTLGFTAPSKGTAGNSSSASNAPYLKFEPVDFSLTTGSYYNGFLDGKSYGLSPATPIVYRKQIPNEDGEFPAPVYMSVTIRLKLNQATSRATLFHYVHCPTASDTTDHNFTNTTATSTSITSTPTGQMLLELLDDAGTIRFRAVAWFNNTSPAERCASIVSAGAASVGTDYTVTMGVAYTGTIYLYVNSASVVTGLMASIDTSDYSPNTPATGSLDPTKYVMSIGRSINTTQQTPDGVDVTYNLSRSLYAEIGQVVIAQPPGTSTFATIHKYVQNNTLTRDTVSSLAMPIMSAWNLGTASIGIIEDLGLTSNTLNYKYDPDFTLAHTTVTTNSISKPRGIFDHFYRTSAGEQHVYVAVTDGAAYTFDVSTGALTLLGDGLRNDNGNRATAMRWVDALILCFGGYGHNHHIWKDQVYRLDIVPPTGVIPFGLTNQNGEEAKLGTGKYRYTFTFWSRFIGKRSPHGPIVEVDVKVERANIAFGDQAEINQTYAQSDEAKKMPYDVSTFASVQRVKMAGWLNGTESGPTSSDPQYDKLLIVTNGSGAVNNSYYEDNEAITFEELDDHVIDRSTRVFVERTVSDRFRFKSAYAGSNARLTMDDTGTILSSANGFEFTTGLPATFSGTGDSSHGLVLPRSSDKQVTHLEVWRTLANDSDFRLVARLPNGATGFVDALEDALNTGEILDVADGAPPPVKFVTEFNGRALFTLDDNNPSFAYFSKIGEPWNVPPQNVVDFRDGSTAEITGVGRTENSVVLFKNDTTFVLTPTASTLAPFDVQVRTRESGCVSPYGIVNVNDTLFYPGELGFYSFDMSFPQRISRFIDPTWRDLGPGARGGIVGIHDRANKQIIWFYPVTDISRCDNAITWNYEVGGDDSGNRYGWATLSGLNVRFASIVQGTDNNDIVFLVDSFGHIYQWNSGNNFGPGTFTATGPLAVTSGGAGTVVIPKVTSYTDMPRGYEGVFLTKVTPAGVRESRLVIVDSLGGTTTTCTMVSNWTTPPTTSDVIYVGSIEMDATFGEISPAAREIVHLWTDTFLRQTAPSVSATFEFRFQGKGGMAANERSQQSVTISNQKTDIKFASSCYGRRLIPRITSFGPDKPVVIRDFTMMLDEFTLPGEQNYDPVT